MSLRFTIYFSKLEICLSASVADRSQLHLVENRVKRVLASASVAPNKLFLSS